MCHNLDLHGKPKFEPSHLWTSATKIIKSICLFILKKLQDSDMVEGCIRRMLHRILDGWVRRVIVSYK